MAFPLGAFRSRDGNSELELDAEDFSSSGDSFWTAFALETLGSRIGNSELPLDGVDLDFAGDLLSVPVSLG